MLFKEQGKVIQLHWMHSIRRGRAGCSIRLRSRFVCVHRWQMPKWIRRIFVETQHSIHVKRKVKSEWKEMKKSIQCTEFAYANRIKNERKKAIIIRFQFDSMSKLSTTFFNQKKDCLLGWGGNYWNSFSYFINYFFSSFRIPFAWSMFLAACQKYWITRTT